MQENPLKISSGIQSFLLSKQKLVNEFYLVSMLLNNSFVLIETIFQQSDSGAALSSKTIENKLTRVDTVVNSETPGRVKKVTLVEQSTIMLTKQKDVEINLGDVESK